MFDKHIALSQQAKYEIRIQGRLTRTDSTSDSIHGWFSDDLRIAYERSQPDGIVTVLTGTVMDQAALFGLLAHIRDLGLILLYVNCLSARGSMGSDLSEAK